MPRRISRWLAAAGVTALIAVGIAAPALADMRTSYMNDWHDGDRSSSWSKTKGDTHVTFDRCTREFRAKIWLEKSFRPDTTKGEEWINCRSYADAVYARNVDAGRYHFDVSGMGFAWCSSGRCSYNLTDVSKLYIHW